MEEEKEENKKQICSYSEFRKTSEVSQRRKSFSIARGQDHSIFHIIGNADCLHWVWRSGAVCGRTVRLEHNDYITELDQTIQLDFREQLD